MMIRKGWFMLLAPLGAAGLLMHAAAGCQDTNKGDDDDGSGASGLTTTTTTTTTGEGGSGNTTTTTTTSGQGGNATCTGEVHTIQDITSGVVGPGVDVRVEGAVVMSQKFLVTKSGAGNCLWGVFVSAPNITTTAPNTGILVASYGFPAEIDEGGTTAYCPKLDEEPQGDAIPQDIQPGDVVNIIGETDYFLLDNCATEENGSQVAARQLAKACLVEKTGTVTPPTPAVIAATDIPRLASPTDTEFHDQWGGVKVTIENVTCSQAEVVGDYGIITLDTTNLEVGDKIYYQGYSDSLCHAGPVFASPATWTSLSGFSYLNYCTWGLQTNDKCADFTPQSTDCTAASCAPY